MRLVGWYHLWLLSHESEIRSLPASSAKGNTCSAPQAPHALEIIFVVQHFSDMG